MRVVSSFSELWNTSAKAIDYDFENLNSKIYDTRELVELLGALKGQVNDGVARRNLSPEDEQKYVEMITDAVSKLIPRVQAVTKAVEDEFDDIRLDIKMGFPASFVSTKIWLLDSRLKAIRDSALGNSGLLGKYAFDSDFPEDLKDYWAKQELKVMTQEDVAKVKE